MDKQVAIEDLKRVAGELKSRSISRSLYDQRGTLASATVEAAFGSWNEAILAAGLIPLPQRGLPKSDERRLQRLNNIAAPQIGNVSDDELLDEPIRSTSANIDGYRFGV